MPMIEHWSLLFTIRHYNLSQWRKKGPIFTYIYEVSFKTLVLVRHSYVCALLHKASNQDALLIALCFVTTIHSNGHLWIMWHFLHCYDLWWSLRHTGTLSDLNGRNIEIRHYHFDDPFIAYCWVDTEKGYVTNNTENMRLRQRLEDTIELHLIHVVFNLYDSFAKWDRDKKNQFALKGSGQENCPFALFQLIIFFVCLHPTQKIHPIAF